MFRSQHKQAVAKAKAEHFRNNPSFHNSKSFRAKQAAQHAVQEGAEKPRSESAEAPHDAGATRDENGQPDRRQSNVFRKGQPQEFVQICGSAPSSQASEQRRKLSSAPPNIVVEDVPRTSDSVGRRSIIRHDWQARTGACDNYRINMAADRFGECMCGFPKAAHKAAARMNCSTPPQARLRCPVARASTLAAPQDGKSMPRVCILLAASTEA